MDVGLISSADISMTFSADQLAVSVPEAPLTNGLNSLPQLPKGTCRATTEHISSASPDRLHKWSASGGTDVPTTHSTSLVSNSTTSTSTRFTVQPAREDHREVYRKVGCDAAALMSDTTSNTKMSGHSTSPGGDSSESDCKKGKKVSFPDGESLIKGFAHAPNPWYNGK